MDRYIPPKCRSPLHVGRRFRSVLELIHSKTGIVINEAKRSMLVSRFARLARAWTLRLRSYRDLLDSADRNCRTRAFISAITTNVTSFFSEPGHFEALAGMVPNFEARAASGERVRIWSAGCSSGEEPYSIAMTLKENWPTIGRADLKVLATDIDPGMVAAAAEASTPAQQVGDDPPPFCNRTCRRDADGEFRHRQALKSNLRFEELNLLGQWPFNGMFDVIFCRNVVIYFDAPDTNGPLAPLRRAFASRRHFSSVTQNAWTPILKPSSSQRASPSIDVLLTPVSTAAGPSRRLTSDIHCNT
jgi:chemotaxis protein methyltransferase CheR